LSTRASVFIAQWAILPDNPSALEKSIGRLGVVVAAFVTTVRGF